MGAIGPNTPLRLKHAAEIAFPDVKVSLGWLRAQAASGNLVIERIAGKDMTTLAHIEEMRLQCRAQPKAPASTLSQRVVPHRAPSFEPPDGSSETVARCTPQDALLHKLQKLTKPSPSTSKPRTGRRVSNVVPMSSRLQTC